MEPLFNNIPLQSYYSMLTVITVNTVHMTKNGVLMELVDLSGIHHNCCERHGDDRNVPNFIKYTWATIEN